MSINIITDAVLFSIAFIALVIGTYTDFKVREVPDWLNYGIIIGGIGIRGLFSLIYWDWRFVVAGLLGLIVFFGIAMLMFYTGQWGGGDSKMLMGLGALIGLEFSLNSFLVGFFINALIFGALFSLVFSVFLLFKNKKRFANAFPKILAKHKKEKWVVWAGVVVLLIASLVFPINIRISIISFASIMLISFYVYAYLKAIETSVMLKWISPDRLTEGDWIAKDVYIAGKKICGPADLGIERRQIKKLVRLWKQGKVKKILVKYGIPFVPSFLIAFIVMFLWGNLLFNILL